MNGSVSGCENKLIALNYEGSYPSADPFERRMEGREAAKKGHGGKPLTAAQRKAIERKRRVASAGKDRY